MKLKNPLIVIAVFALFLPTSVLAVSSPPPIPLLIYGSVEIDGQLAPTGTEISAEIDSVEIATILTTKEGKYFIEVPDGDNNEGKVIKFRVNGITDDNNQTLCVNVATSPSIGLNLAVNTPPAPTPDTGPTGGGGGSSDSTGGSGGGGTPVVQTTSSNQNQLSAAAQTVNTNNDNKIDILDFNTLMVNWGSTGANNIADFDNNGQVDIFDFNLLMIHWTG